MEHRIHIIVGHYGSGKTEFAINYALALKKHFKTVYIVDLDIVNPYFRTNDVKEKLEKMGLSVIASPYASSNVDIPALPPDIFKVFSDESSAVVFDVGGDDDGAVALGRYKQYFDAETPEMLFVINPYRPLTAERDQIIEMIRSIEAVSRQKVTGLVNSANLAGMTTKEETMTGRRITESVSQATGIPYLYTAVTPEVLAQLPQEASDFTKTLFTIQRFMALNF